MNISVDDFFNHSFVITIDDKRHSRFCNVFSKFLGESRIPRKYEGFSDNELEPSYNCMLSHASVVKMAKCLGYPFVVIFEDDAYPRIDIIEKLEHNLKIIPDDAKVISFGWSKCGIRIDYDDSFFKINDYCWGTQSYLIFKNSYDDYLCEYGKNTKMTADAVFGHFKENAYMVNENLFIQYCSSKSMNGYEGYIYDNLNHDSPPEGFCKIEEILT